VIDFLRGQLSDEEQDLIADNQLCISDIVLWEIAKLNQLKRINLNLDDRMVKRFFSNLKIFPIDLEIAAKSCLLDFKADPADEIIAATSFVHQIPLLTRDKKIRSSKLLLCLPK